MDPIERGTKGAEFIKADLHIHTPASSDYVGDPTPEEFLQDFVDEGIELIAVTDHNSSAWYDRLQEAAEESPIHVLPGVEITTPQGGENQIHMTAIFSPDNHSQVNHILSQVGINPEASVDEQADERVKSIARTVLQHGGIPILAHIDTAAGAHSETGPGQIRDEIFDPEVIAAIEYVEERHEAEYPDFPAIRSSDAHRPEEIGRGFTFLKMTEPSFEGLQTALSDPDSRIRFDEPEIDHPRILGVRCNGVFLDQREVQLNPHLNCLIGGKGAGKSALIEHVRYALDITPRTERIDGDYLDLISNTLGDEGEVEVQIQIEGGQKYSITRVYQQDPEIEREDGTAVEMEIGTFKEEFFDIELHSQNELLELARDTRDQLDLIDSYLEFGDSKSLRDELKTRLSDNATRFDTARQELNQLEENLRDLTAFREKLAVMEEQGVEEYLEGQDDWEAEQRRLERYETTIREAITEVDGLQLFEDPVDEEVDGDSPNRDLIIDARDALSEAYSESEEFRSDWLERLESHRDTIGGLVDDWEELKDEWRGDFEEIQDEIEAETEVDVDQYFELRDEATRLDGTEDELAEKRSEIDELESERGELLDRLDDVRSEITEIRRAGSENISDNLADVRVRLEANGNRTEYREWFNRVLRGSRVHTDDKERVSELYDPRELTEIIEERDTARLIDEADLTPTGADNLVEHEALRNQLHVLQTQEIHDKPIVEIQEEGTWKSLDRMSEGQQSTALLSIATLEREMPLIVDQPEDQLDNEFIYDVVVDVIRRVKDSRQIIMPTHNANIPILGDAEQILVMWSNGQNGYIQERGSIDSPVIRERAQKILEGGEEAFTKRTEKYGTGVLPEAVQ